MSDKHRISKLKNLLDEMENQGYKSYASIEREFGISASYLSQIINGSRNFGETAARNFEEKLGLPNLYLDRTDDDEETLKIDVHEGYSSNDKGIIVFGTVYRTAILAVDFFKRRGIHPNDFKMFIANSKNMEPFIVEGDEIGVIESAKKIINADVYAITLNGEMMIVQIFKEAAGSLRLHNINTNYPDCFVHKEAMNSLKILGKQIYRAG